MLWRKYVDCLKQNHAQTSTRSVRRRTYRCIISSHGRAVDLLVDLVDERPEWTRLSYDVVGVKAHETDPIQFLKSNDMSKRHFFTVATHAHDLDQKIIETLLKQDLQASYIGLVGSRGKWARFQDRLSAKVLTPRVSIRSPVPVALKFIQKRPKKSR